MDNDKIKTLYELGKSLREIAKELDVTPSAISYILKKLGVPTRKTLPKTAISKEEITKILNSGATLADIARKENVSTTIIKRILNGNTKNREKTYNYITPDAALSHISIEEIKNLIDQKLTNIDIAIKLGINRRTVGDICIRHNLRLPKIKNSIIINPRKKFPLTIDEFKQLHLEDKLSLSEIARRHNLKMCWVSTWARRNGLEIITKPTKSSGITKEMLESDCKNRLSIGAIAYKYNVSDTLIYNKLKLYELEPGSISRFKIEQIRDKDQTAQEISLAMKQKWENKEYKDKIIKANINRLLLHHHDKAVCISKPHYKVIRILDTLNVKYEIEFPLGPYTFDIFIPSHNILIEVQGDYWHSLPQSINRDKSKNTYVIRHFPKYVLKYIWEHECLMEDKILEKIKYWLGITKTEIIDFDLSNVIINEPNQKIIDEFLYNWHYIHHGRHGIDFGGYLNNELIVVARFTTPSRQEIATSLEHKFNEVLELSRLCVHPKYQKKNLLSWFLSKIEDKIPNNIRCLVAFSDTSYGHTGVVYKASNWELISTVPPNYYYTDSNGWVMHKKTLWDHAKKMCMKESEFAEKYGYNKIWGKEKLKFIKKLR